MKKNALVIGSKGTIGEALVAELTNQYRVFEVNQQNCDYSELTLQERRESFAREGPFSVIICCIGTLHNKLVSPEKRMADLTEETLAEYFRINSILPALCVRTFHDLLDKTAPSRLVALSAMVGSIGDNNLGGWYGYRSSKAALNMLIRSASIEVKRTNKQACLATIHPGTTIGPLTKPFARNIAKDKYYTPKQSAQRIVAVTESLQADQTGFFLNWDGLPIPW